MLHLCIRELEKHLQQQSSSFHLRQEICCSLPPKGGRLITFQCTAGKISEDWILRVSEQLLHEILGVSSHAFTDTGDLIKELETLSHLPIQIKLSFQKCD